MSKTWFNIAHKPSNLSVLQIDIFEPIGFWGVSAQQFVMQLRAAGPVPEIELNIDCPGGDCEEGFTIYDALKSSSSKITANIIGTAASMASVIMCAASTINIAENGRVMIHRVSAEVEGNADDIAAAAAITKQFEDRIVNIYCARTGKPEAEVRDLMKSELGTWFFGQQAIDAGFCDALITGQKAAAFKNTWASLFTVLPSALFDTAPKPLPPRTSMKALLKLAALVGVTGIPDDATEDQIIAAFTAHKPKEKNVVLDFEDAGVKAAFSNAVKLETKALIDKNTELEGKIKALEDANKNFTALNSLIASGAAGASIVAAAVQASQSSGADKTKNRAEFSAMTPAARATFLANGGKLTD